MTSGHFFRILTFFHSASDLRHFEGDTEGPEEELAFQRSIHKRFVISGAAGGLLGLLLGIALVVVAISDTTATPQPAKQDDVLALFLAPVVLAMGGLVLGAAVACATAPSRFLTGPAGWKWMQLVGTESTLTARIVCWLIIVMLGVLPLTGGLLLWWHVLKNG